MEFSLVLVFIALAFVAYFIPAIVATSRNHNNSTAIMVLNLLLGWTFLGWVGALIWSCTNDVQPKYS